MNIAKKVRKHKKIHNHIAKRIVGAVLVLMFLVLFGTIGFYLIGKFYIPGADPTAKPWTLLNCFYMMLITVTTTGYGEVLSRMDLPLVRVFTSFMLFCGLGVYVYFVSNMTTFFVEGAFSQITQRRKMEKHIRSLKDHIIICGVGSTGIHILKELLVTKWPVVIIDVNEDAINSITDEMQEYGKIPYVVGDALDDKTLFSAGLKDAYGLVAALPADKDNLFVTITARQENKKLRIVSRAVDLRTSQRMKIAGADSVVSTNYIGGLRMVSEMIRPQVVEFIDLMMRDKKKNLRLEEITISEKSGLNGTTIGEADISVEGFLLIIAIKNPKDGSYLYGPGSEYVLKSGNILVVMGDPGHVAKLRNKISGLKISKDK
jgi:voltage-gated potassium channel